MNHWVSEVPNKKIRRCAGDNCKSHVQTMHLKCDLGLCIPCFRIFHEKRQLIHSLFIITIILN